MRSIAYTIPDCHGLDNKKTEDERTGSNWNVFEKQEDLEFADGMCLITTNRRQMQEKITKLNRNSRKTGLKINVRRTKPLTNNTNRWGERLLLYGQRSEFKRWHRK